MSDPMTRLGLFLIAEHDRAKRDIERTKVMPQMHAKAEGRLDGIDTALAYIAGTYGYRSVAVFIAVARNVIPSDDSIPEGELRALDGNR